MADGTGIRGALTSPRPFLAVAAQPDGQGHRGIGSKAQQIAGRKTDQLGLAGANMALPGRQFGEQARDLGHALILPAAYAYQPRKPLDQRPFIGLIDKKPLGFFELQPRERVVRDDARKRTPARAPRLIDRKQPCSGNALRDKGQLLPEPRIGTRDPAMRRGDDQPPARIARLCHVQNADNTRKQPWPHADIGVQIQPDPRPGAGVPMIQGTDLAALGQFLDTQPPAALCKDGGAGACAAGSIVMAAVSDHDQLDRPLMVLSQHMAEAGAYVIRLVMGGQDDGAGCHSGTARFWAESPGVQGVGRTGAPFCLGWRCATGQCTRKGREIPRIIVLRHVFSCRVNDLDVTMPVPGESSAGRRRPGRHCFIRGKGATGLTPATGNQPDKMPAGQTAPNAAWGQVSSKFIRREAALAASDAKHARIIAQRFALLRTRILREMRSRGWRKLAVVPVTPGAGGTFVAVNLALALARQPHTRVALIDFDLGRPGVAGQLGIPGCTAVSAALREGGDLGRLVSRVNEAPNLSVLAPERAEPNAAELLQDEALAQAMTRLHDNRPVEISIIDTAALLDQDAALAALPLTDALLLVADGRRGTAADMEECERLLAGMPPVMGVVLNKSED